MRALGLAGTLLVISAALIIQPAITEAAEDVDGGWTVWSLGGNSCNATCGTGYYRKLRTCSNPSPQGAGQQCLKQDGVTRALQEISIAECNTHPCASGGFSEWGNCTVECNIGKQFRYAMCGGDICAEGTNQYVVEERECNTWNKSSCPKPCLEYAKNCPEYAICEDKSDETRPNPVCKCTMGYEMNKAKTHCLRPPPTTPTPRPIPTLAPEEKTVAVVVSKTASTVLIVFVGITLTLFLLLRIMSPDRVIQMNMEIAIISAHICLMFPPETVQVEILCRIISILIHFFFTACFMFMLLESLHMYSLVAYVVKKDGLFTRVQNTLIGWGLSAFIVLVTMSFEYDNYGGVYHCWLQMDKPLCTGQYIPIIAIMIITFTLIEAAGAADYAPLKEVDKSQRLSARISQRSNLIIMPLVFASFVIGMLSEYEQDLALYGTFSVLNGIVGGVIFFFHCTGNQQVRAKMVRCCQMLKRRRRR
ncbi:adhesion G-protein coupled receptor D1-like [Amphibalanus amphitrite]|uniref:adhesion G-protein coupled receptor D1-like n=1 Tax=Amphibalanus amphitrite TaxID=1232801 RepID=UPI001C900552|nr:adhesion G-protein coupled receptor D1-like [Amphibalanus amphitrite]XP_043219190.1 adhesion G-protein coupled receptor D1-like [Amphibalanus amphitrite]XP_043219191.1 adhesion G-protein coupled receptor D1-like [Amphibalanus amphitrite]